MRQPYNHDTQADNLRSARRTLINLVTHLGAAGIAAGRRFPALLAQIDQHATAIRQALSPFGGELSIVALAGYAEGLRSITGEAGWPSAPTSAERWLHADPIVLRLVAVCQLATASPGRPPRPHPPAPRR